MCARPKLASQSELQSFTYPKLHVGKSWYIDFLAYDPAEGRMKRKKYMLDNIPTKAQRRIRAAEIISSTDNSRCYLFGKGLLPDEKKLRVRSLGASG